MPCSGTACSCNRTRSSRASRPIIASTRCCATRSCPRPALEAESMTLAVVPTRALVWLCVAPLALSAFVALEPSLLKSVLLLDGALLGAALIDLLFCLRRQLEIRRTAPDVLSLKRRNLVRLELSSRAARRLRVEVQDDLFAGAD